MLSVLYRCGILKQGKVMACPWLRIMSSASWCRASTLEWWHWYWAGSKCHIRLSWLNRLSAWLLINPERARKVTGESLRCAFGRRLQSPPLPGEGEDCSRESFCCPPAFPSDSQQGEVTGYERGYGPLLVCHFFSLLLLGTSVATSVSGDNCEC